MKKLLLAAVLPFCLQAPAMATCPNESSTLTVPLVGSALAWMNDQSCNVLDGTQTQVSIGGVTLTGTTKPAAIYDAVGAHISANGAAVGSTGVMTLKYVPNGLTKTMTYVVGSAITGVTASTTSP